MAKKLSTGGDSVVEDILSAKYLQRSSNAKTGGSWQGWVNSSKLRNPEHGDEWSK